MASKLTPYRGKRFYIHAFALSARLSNMPNTQGSALGYEQVGPSGRSLSEKVYLYIIPKIFLTNVEIKVNLFCDLPNLPYLCPYLRQNKAIPS